jgi:hypothetical protein
MSAAAKPPDMMTRRPSSWTGRSLLLCRDQTKVRIGLKLANGKTFAYAVQTGMLTT